MWSSCRTFSRGPPRPSPRRWSRLSSKETNTRSENQKTEWRPIDVCPVERDTTQRQEATDIQWRQEARTWRDHVVPQSTILHHDGRALETEPCNWSMASQHEMADPINWRWRSGSGSRCTQLFKNNNNNKYIQRKRKKRYALAKVEDYVVVEARTASVYGRTCSFRSAVGLNLNDEKKDHRTSPRQDAGLSSPARTSSPPPPPADGVWRVASDQHTEGGRGSGF